MPTGKTKQKNAAETEKMKKYVDEMLKDLKKAHGVREDQLSQAAQGYKARLEKTLRRHEELLVAYRYGESGFHAPAHITCKSTQSYK